MASIFNRRNLLAGLLVGTLDISGAGIQTWIKTGKGIEAVLRYVASGAFGKEAFTGGYHILLWGLLFHFMIALSYTFLFFALVRMIPALLKRRILLAVGYAFLMWAGVRFLVIPFSQITPAPPVLKNVLIAVAILLVCISGPLCLFAGKYRSTR
jgi:hypothetical protein